MDTSVRVLVATRPNFYWASLEIHSARIEASEQALLEALRKRPGPGKGGSA